MKRFYSLLAIAMLAVVTSATPVGAEVDSNPHAIAYYNISCDNGRTFDVIWGPNGQDVPGHDLETNLVGAVTSIWLADSSGDRVAPVWERPGRGLAEVTTWCWWAAPSPTGYVGVDVIFRATER